MKVKWKLLFPAILSAVSMLGGCQPQEPAGSSAPVTSPASSTPSTAGTADAAGSDGSASTYLSDTLAELHVMCEDSASAPLLVDSETIKYVEEYLNVKIILEAVPSASYADKKKVLISTDNMPDIMKINLSDLRQFAREGMFVNLSENKERLPNFFTVLDQNPDIYKLSIDGEMFSFPTMRRPSAGDDPNGQQPVIRSDLIKEYGLEYPDSFEELYEVLKVFKQNRPGSIPLTNRKGGNTSGTQKVLDTMAYPLGSGSKMYYDQDIGGGQYVYGPAHENFKEVLRYLNQLYAEGLLDPDYATNTSDIWKEKMSSGKALMYFDNTGFRMDFEAALKTLEPNATYDVFPTMENSFGQRRNFIFEQHWSNSHYVVASSSENIDLALAYMDWSFGEQGCDILNYGVPGVHFDKINGVPVMKTSVWDAFIAAGSNGPSYDLQSKLGIGLPAFTPYVDVGASELMKNYMLDGEAAERSEATAAMNRADTGLRRPVYDPPLSQEDNERYNQLLSAVENIVVPEFDKYIMGLEPIENYDAVIERARTAGAQEMEDIFNRANEAYQ